MEKSEMIWIASVAFHKKMSFSNLNYSDYMNGKTEFTDDVWEYVTECEEIGTDAFYEKYKKFKLY